MAGAVGRFMLVATAAAAVSSALLMAETLQHTAMAGQQNSLDCMGFSSQDNSQNANILRTDGRWNTQ